jgi:hypothetical protein
MFRRKYRKALVLGAVTSLVIVAGAIAYWTTTGTGTGSAATGTIAGVTVNQTSTPTAMYPGGPAQPLSGDFTNTNSGNAYVTSVTASLASVSGGAADLAKPPCTTADFQLNDPTAVVGQDIAPGAGQGSWSGPSVQLINTGFNQDNCKNATLHISYTSA